MCVCGEEFLLTSSWLSPSLPPPPVCTMVTHTTAPPFVHNGTTAKIYVNLTAEPPPSEVRFAIELDDQATAVDNASLTLGSGPHYTKIYEFRVPGVTDASLLGFIVRYSTSEDCSLPSADTSVNEELDVRRSEGSLSISLLLSLWVVLINSHTTHTWG